MKCIILILSLIPLHISAKEFRWTHFGLRPLGGGNAFVAVADDYNALFYNPAGLGRLETFDGEFFNPAITSSFSTPAFFIEIFDLLNSTEESTAKLFDIYKERSGVVHYGSFDLTPHFITKNFGIGLGIHVPVSFTPKDINIDVEAGLRLIMPMSFAFSFLEDRLNLGATIKGLLLTGIDEEFDSQDIETLNPQDAVSEHLLGGTGVGFDVGLLFTPMDVLEPTIGLSIIDLGGSVYSAFDVGGKNTKPPRSRAATLNTGVSLKPIKTDVQYLRTSVDAHGINLPLHFSHKLNFGVEWGYTSLLKLQLGLKQGLLTTGLQFDVGLLNIRLAFYQVDHGSSAGLHDRLIERRFAGQLKMLL